MRPCRSSLRDQASWPPWPARAGDGSLPWGLGARYGGAAGARGGCPSAGLVWVGPESKGGSLPWRPFSEW